MAIIMANAAILAISQLILDRDILTRIIPRQTALPIAITAQMGSIEMIGMTMMNGFN
jgi:hypothetical protein